MSRSTPYLAGRFFDGISSGMFMLALPWIMLSQGDMGVFVAALSLLCTLLSFFTTPFSATFIDRHSRKSILITIQLIQASTALAVLIAFQLEKDTLWLLALAQIIFWLTNDIAWSTNNAFTQENYDKSEYARITGQQEVVMQLTTLGAGAAGIVLLTTWSMIEFSLLATLASAIAAFSYFCTPYRRQLKPQKSQPFFSQLGASRAIFARRPAFFMFLALSCLTYPMLSYLAKLVPVYFSEQQISGSWFASWSLSYGVGALITGLLITRLLARFSHEKAMISAVLIMGCLLLIMSFWLIPEVLVALTVVLGFFNAFNRIARTNKMNHEVSVHERGRIEGGLKLFSVLSQGLGFTLIAVLSGLNLTAFGFTIMGIIILLAGFTMQFLYRRQAHVHLATA
ncbi:MFS transporter [Photobacterium sp. 1_MG-2023]|uniref:MFS transporter n=1 Tax=Photobacterium sp. 1_MG-2023 TaxID=3062646 RepID=UPI0026E46E72|nr:MFS transporter [Photobacterium sp. 1_MG-2023]MDO6707225.1 MFS transporter [Photobacterium sp. 1_MG-2023]